MVDLQVNPAAHDDPVLVEAALLAQLAAAEAKAANLEIALRTARLIGAAVGIVMVIEQLPYEKGFERLTATSQNLNRKLADIADQVVLTGTLPNGPDNRQ